MKYIFNTCIVTVVSSFLIVTTAYGQAPGTTPMDGQPNVSDTLEDIGVVIRNDQPEGSVLAVALPDVYILPDSSLYWVVKVWESIQLIIVEDPAERADLLLDLSKKRLAETYKLVEEDNINEASININRYRGQLSQALGIIQDLPDDQTKAIHYDELSEQVWYQKALVNVLEVESVTTVLYDVSSVLEGVRQEFGFLELQSLN